MEQWKWDIWLLITPLNSILLIKFGMLLWSRLGGWVGGIVIKLLQKRLHQTFLSNVICCDYIYGLRTEVRGHSLPTTPQVKWAACVILVFHREIQSVVEDSCVTHVWAAILQITDIWIHVSVLDTPISEGIVVFNVFTFSNGWVSNVPKVRGQSHGAATSGHSEFLRDSVCNLSENWESWCIKGKSGLKTKS